MERFSCLGVRGRVGVRVGVGVGVRVRVRVRVRRMRNRAGDGYTGWRSARSGACGGATSAGGA